MPAISRFSSGILYSSAFKSGGMTSKPVTRSTGALRLKRAFSMSIAEISAASPHVRGAS